MTTILAGAQVSPSGLPGPPGIALPVGSILDFAGDTAPTGWLFCGGQLISRTTYAALFAIVGIKWSPGDGTTTFGLPDLRGVVIAGRQDMGGTNAFGRLSRQKVCNTTSANATITITAAGSGSTLATVFDLFRLERVWGAGIPADTSILSFPASNQITLSRNASATQTGVTLSFGMLDPSVVGMQTAITQVWNGADAHQLNASEMPAHQHAYQKSIFVAVSGVQGGATFNLQDSAQSTDFRGGDWAHDNVQPTTILNKIIYAGV
jgi:microcystin-dependent protein